MILRAAASGQSDKVAQGFGTAPQMLYCIHKSTNPPTMENKNIVIAVIGGDYSEGEDFDTLRLFDSISKANAYAEEMRRDPDVDYVLVREKSVK